MYIFLYLCLYLHINFGFKEKLNAIDKKELALHKIPPVQKCNRLRILNSDDF